ncbi:MAG: alpha-D-ribose 1-methylphosphonate 5-triphosphate synthase subunit PhnH [Deferribacteres bacterium]|jgi:phosphonate C-P lyase system protein PhnH|nr:phnH [Deferribacteraceae bacterium]MDK2793244.1 alpha-D-ribose 1-methylphosphonate 5-triphosphate synthase subunit PhnH [Deferribacteres bacterium]
MIKFDIEKINRENFRKILKGFSYPATKSDIELFMNDIQLTFGVLFLYSNVTYYIENDEKFEVIKSITNAEKVCLDEADYVFLSEFTDTEFTKCKIGNILNPEKSTTVIMMGANSTINVKLNGPGIENEKFVDLPLTEKFVENFRKINGNFPLGLDFIIYDNKNSFFVLTRTTKLEV